MNSMGSYGVEIVIMSLLNVEGHRAKGEDENSGYVMSVRKNVVL